MTDTKVKHTPGPWEAKYDGPPLRPYIIRAQCGPIVAEGYCDDLMIEDSGEIHANARLIAAAPELAEHAAGLVAELRANFGNDFDAPHFGELCAALKKAGLL